MLTFPSYATVSPVTHAPLWIQETMNACEYHPLFVAIENPNDNSKDQEIYSYSRDVMVSESAYDMQPNTSAAFDGCYHEFEVPNSQSSYSVERDSFEDSNAMPFEECESLPSLHSLPMSLQVDSWSEFGPDSLTPVPSLQEVRCAESFCESEYESPFTCDEVTPVYHPHTPPYIVTIDIEQPVSTPPTVYNHTIPIPTPEALQEIIDCGLVRRFAYEQNGSRYLQRTLRQATDQEKQGVFEQIDMDIIQLAYNVFGNYVIQKIIEVSEQHRARIGDIIKGHCLQLSLSVYGCRVIQKSLEYFDNSGKLNLVKELTPHIKELIKSDNGNHVIQKCMKEIPSMNLDAMHKIFEGNVYQFSIHIYGCRVIQRLLENSTSDIKTVILEEALEHVTSLAKNPWGNYVIQHVLEHGPHWARERIVKVLKYRVVSLSRHKYASNVIEKCFTFGTNKQRNKLLRELLRAEDENLANMMKDPYGNYVIQKVLELASVSQARRILGRVRKIAEFVLRSTNGKRILAKIEQITGQPVFKQ